MICSGCGFDAPKKEYRYLYTSRLDSPISMRQCPKCMIHIAVDDLKGEIVQQVQPGDDIWGKSVGIGASENQKR